MERRIEVETRHLRLLQKLLHVHLIDKAVWAYGSRVQRYAHPNSDLDLVVRGASDSQIANAKAAFAESNLPFTVRLLAWENIPEDFKRKIREQHVVLQDGSKIPEGWREIKLEDLAVTTKGNKRLHPDIIAAAREQEREAVVVLRERNEFTPNYQHGILDLSQNCYAVHSFDDRLSAKFCGYYLENNKTYFESVADGSTVISIPITYFQTFPISLPPLSEQKAIAEVLGSLDDKLGLLHRQNKTLEDMMQALFIEWFVDGADESWERKPLNQVAYFCNGLAWQAYLRRKKAKKLPILKIKELTSGFHEYTDWFSYEVNDKYIVNLGDIIFSWSGTLVLKIWDGEKCILNQHLFKVTSEQHPNWFLYYWIKHYLREYIASAETEVVTMTHLRHEDLEASSVPIPPDNTREEVSTVMEAAFVKMIANLREINTLNATRKMLLPRLLSGNLRVKFREDYSQEDCSYGNEI